MLGHSQGANDLGAANADAVRAIQRPTPDDFLIAASLRTPIVVDGNACPGNGFYPASSQTDPPGGRRLREYIGIATSGHRAFITWTHAPEAPSRVHVAHMDF